MDTFRQRLRGRGLGGGTRLAQRARYSPIVSVTHTVSHQPGGVIMKRKLPAAAWILIAMVLGIVVGYLVFINFPDKKIATQIAGYISIISDVFLRLIKMLIGPLVFSTLVVGVAHMGDAASVGRV